MMKTTSGNTQTIFTVSNIKIQKSLKFGYMTIGLHLHPTREFCKNASKGCWHACLNTSGRGRFKKTRLARLKKNQFFIEFPAEFKARMKKEITKHIKKALKLKVRLCIRLNLTTDNNWQDIEFEDGLNIFDYYPDIQFYDYTPDLSRSVIADLPANYHLTFSRKEDNELDWTAARKRGFNIAIVYDEITYNWMVSSSNALDGEKSDLRFLEGYQGKIVALKAKGKAIKDTTGFVIR